MSQAWSRVDKTVGTRLRITTSNGEDVEGYLLVYDPQLNCVALQERCKEDVTKRNVRILPCNAISLVSVISGKPSDAVVRGWNSLPPIDWNRVAAREERTRQHLRDNAPHSGLAHKVFQVLSKTYPCQWDGDVIIVLESLQLVPPYRPEDLSATSEDKYEAVARVRKLLESKVSR